MDEKERRIIILRQKNRCWNFFKFQKDLVLGSTKTIRKTINDINKQGYSELSDLTNISEALNTIENQMLTVLKQPHSSMAELRALDLTILVQIQVRLPKKGN